MADSGVHGTPRRPTRSVRSDDWFTNFLMAVKIVDETPDPDVVKRISCRNCGARLEYVPADVKTRNGTDYTGSADGEEYIDCPKCGKRAIIRCW